jgi:hypothetical protein
MLAKVRDIGLELVELSAPKASLVRTLCPIEMIFDSTTNHRACTRRDSKAPKIETSPNAEIVDASKRTLVFEATKAYMAQAAAASNKGSSSSSSGCLSWLALHAPAPAGFRPTIECTPAPPLSFPVKIGVRSLHAATHSAVGGPVGRDYRGI